ncbi:MAG: acyltransferase [Marinilabiliaceae bacterium]|nr:acyltransferase [Marinilabiliaceae bacterium]
MGKDNVFHYGTEIRGITDIQMGDGCIIGGKALLDGRSGLVFGNNVNLSSNVSIYTLQHDHRDPDFGGIDGKVVIGGRAWLGSNIVVFPGVTIGEGAVCCAGCVVTKDVLPYTVVAGIPAKKVNERPQVLRYEFDGKSVRLI